METAVVIAELAAGWAAARLACVVWARARRATPRNASAARVPMAQTALAPMREERAEPLGMHSHLTGRRLDSLVFWVGPQVRVVKAPV